MQDVSKWGKVVATIALYWVVAISMVFANKKLLGDEKSTEDLSLFIAWYQCCVVVIATWCASKLSSGFRWSDRKRLFSPELLLHGNVIILSLTFVSGLVFNNLMLRHIGVAFYQVARSSTLVFVVILSHFLIAKIINVRVILCCSVVIGGYFLGADQEGADSGIPLMGIVYGMAASFIIALGGTFMKKSENVMDKDCLKLTFSYNFNSVFILLVLLVSTGQYGTILNSSKVWDPWFWTLLTCSGILSTLIGLASALQIQFTSPTTHHISISAKSVTQTVLAVLYFHEVKTLLWWLGNGMTIIGTVSYALIKLQDYSNAQRNIDMEISASHPPHSRSANIPLQGNAKYGQNGTRYNSKII